MPDPLPGPTQTDRPPDQSRSRVLRNVALLALALSVAYLAWRGVSRGLDQSGDLAVGFSAARAWLVGDDPYAVPALQDQLLRGGAPDLANGTLLETLRNVYFPATLPLFLPLGLLAWQEARIVGLAINVGLSLFIAVGVSRLVGWRVASPRSILLAAFILALAPLHTTIAFGQTGIVATAAIVAAILAERAGHLTASGFWYGLATVAKVQIGLPFIAYLLWRRRWAPALVACAVPLVAGALGVGRMHLAGVPWLDSWLANLVWLSRPGGINDPSVANPDRFSLINLEYLVHSIVGGGWPNQALVVGLVASAALVFVWLHRGRDARPDLLALAVVATLGLLVAYHRYYDAVLLAIPIAWACSVLGTERRVAGIAVLVLCLDFLLPMQSIAFELERRGILPQALTDALLWDAVVLAQHVWALILMAAVLLYVAFRVRRTGPIAAG